MASRPRRISRRDLLGLAAITGLHQALGCGRTPAAAGGTSSRGDEAPAPPVTGPADLIVSGGTILTMDPRRPRAAALAARAGEIVAVGSLREIERLGGPSTTRVALAGGTATAGLTDAHGHVAGLGRSLEQVDLRGAKSIDEVLARLRAHRSDARWLEGRGWDQNLWPGQQMPTQQRLSEAFPDRPVWLRRIDGHAGWGNAALLREARITSSTPDPGGGEILRDPSGEPTGVLVDAAMGLVRSPTVARADLRRWILAAQRHLLARGLTGAHDMGVGSAEDQIYRQLARDDSDRGLGMRVHGYASSGWFVRELQQRKPDVPTKASRYALVGVKLLADGALGSRGAALLAPYSDRPDHRGLLQHGQAELDHLCERVMAAGWQAATHAIGDAANRAVLDAYERAARRHRRKDHRFRIEHAQVLALEDIERLAKLGIIASMQPTHATSDMPWAEARLGAERLRGAYAWRRMLESGARLCFGSDFPVEQADVTHGLHAAVTRQDAKGMPAGGWLPDQRLTLHEALHAFSTGAAFAVRRDDQLGRLAPGMQADLTCFAQDITALPPAELRAAPIAATIVGGRVRFRA